MSMRDLLSKIKGFFVRKPKGNIEESAIQSDLNHLASMRIDAESINQSITQSINRLNLQHEVVDKSIISNEIRPLEAPESEKKKSILLEEDSLKLGVAAGFVGRSLMNIEDQLSKISSEMPTREWLLSQIKEMTKELSMLGNVLHDHEMNEEKRFEALMTAIKNISSLATTLPEPYQTSILKEVEKIKETQLTPKMKDLLSIVKARGELSYAELSQELGITQDALRGLLSRTIRLTEEIERFQKDGKGWVRYKKKDLLGDKSDSHRFESIKSQESLGDKQEKPADFSDLP